MFTTRAIPRIPFLLFWLAPLAAAGCDTAVGGATPAATPPAAYAEPARLDAVDDSAFGALVEALSEPDAYFDTDNLISNESSYLHVVGALERLGVRGGAYVGVGPAQNFSYLVAVRPSLAFLVDIRRDNLLQHLWFKALFEAAATRLDYLCMMVSRACSGPGEGLSIGELVERVDAAAPVPAADSLVERLVAAAASHGVTLDSGDSVVVRSIHRRFAADGLDLQFNTHGRAPRWYYPTLRRLLLERDLDGRQANYLATEEGYRFVRALQRANRVVPVVGDLAGDHALRAIGREVHARDEAVSAFYASNVEFYLFQDGVFDRFVDNLTGLPIRENSVIIRSYFNRSGPVPGSVSGYASAQLLQPIGELVEGWREGRMRTYREVARGGHGVN